MVLPGELGVIKTVSFRSPQRQDTVCRVEEVSFQPVSLWGGCRIGSDVKVLGCTTLRLEETSTPRGEPSGKDGKVETLVMSKDLWVDVGILLGE